MKVKVIDYVEDVRNFKQGYVDIKVIYSQEKFEIFRNLGYFEKDGKRWLSLPNCKRDDKWLPIYERLPSLNREIFALALDDLEQFKANMGIE